MDLLSLVESDVKKMSFWSAKGFLERLEKRMKKPKTRLLEESADKAHLSKYFKSVQLRIPEKQEELYNDHYVSNKINSKALKNEILQNKLYTTIHFNITLYWSLS